MDIVAPRPDPAAMSLGVEKGLRIAFIRSISIENPCPAVEDHFQLDVAEDEVVLLQIGHGNNPSVPIDDAAGVHFQQEHQLEPLSVDYSGQEVFRFMTAELLHLWRIDEAKTHCRLDLPALPWDTNAGQEAVAVEHPNDRHPKRVCSRVFWREEQVVAPIVGTRSSAIEHGRQT